MRCPSCGTEVEASLAACPGCGRFKPRRLVPAGATAQSAAVMPPPADAVSEAQRAIEVARPQTSPLATRGYLLIATAGTLVLLARVRGVTDAGWAAAIELATISAAFGLVVSSVGFGLWITRRISLPMFLLGALVLSPLLLVILGVVAFFVVMAAMLLHTHL